VLINVQHVGDVTPSLLVHMEVSWNRATSIFRV